MGGTYGCFISRWSWIYRFTYVVELINAGHDVVIVDDYSNSCPESIKRVEEITGKSIVSYEADVKRQRSYD